MVSMKILKLDGGHAFSRDDRAMAGANVEMKNVTNLDQYKLATTDLTPYNVLVVTDFIDQEHLFENKEIIERFLDDGKIVIACTHIFRNWLSGINPFMPRTIRNHMDYEMKVTNMKSIFRGVDMLELAYRKGVSGFYARGYHPLANQEVEVHLAFLDGTPITFVDRTTTKGTIVAHSGRDLLTYETGENSTQLISKQTLEWIESELALLDREKEILA
ncbi:phosphate starvation-inducible protein PhoH [Lysinibacillus sp. SGAir0095]|uniref:phosphate starvation-inducible protein PhoH n=1 Tax=Lysinibacillus sp. SGAir0095 TaxID=2070463 RepID=UPI0010CD532A|nr:phosphate starvation-inducible protein PhoH [Lysinibacillus sp. SGAir0095]QCR33598.1 phosphate starvation-inducible protein PhoH [Lysinibacillus sp. SGAir0095]